MTQEQKRPLTGSMHHPNNAALKHSSSPSARPCRISIESTTDSLRFSFPPGTLYSQVLHITSPAQVSSRLEYAQGEAEERAYAVGPVNGVLGHALLAEVREELVAEHGEHVLELLAFLCLCVCHSLARGVMVVGRGEDGRWRDRPQELQTTSSPAISFTHCDVHGRLTASLLPPASLPLRGRPCGGRRGWEGL